MHHSLMSFGLTVVRLSGTVFDKVVLFLTIVARLLGTNGGNMSILLAAETLNFVHVLSFSVSCIGK